MEFYLDTAAHQTPQWQLEPNDENGVEVIFRSGGIPRFQVGRPTGATDQSQFLSAAVPGKG